MRNGKPATPDNDSKYRLLRSILLILIAITLPVIFFWERLTVLKFIGGFFLTSILLFIFYRDIKRYRPSLATNLRLLSLLGIILVFNPLIGRLFQYMFQGFVHELGFVDMRLAIYAIPLPLGAMLVALLFDIHTAIIFSFMTSLIAGIWLNDAIYPIYVFSGSITATLGVIRCRKRSDILKAGLFVGVANAFTALSITLLQRNLIAPSTLVIIGFAFLNGFMVISVASVLLPLLEYLFNLTTDISLLELMDLNQPLMRNLLVEAPGTYHHSIIVGNLVEAAAEVIGVNPLLARVSAYYHDIGKIKMPEYFVENQEGPISRHDKLTPNMSSLIIISHVKEGVELARQNKLPEVIIDIIQQHHGTNLITYFYQKAKDQHPPESHTLSEAEFRYPGPKPQTRVSALLMMADAVEAASRALTEPTPSRISALVDRIINHIFLDGQLDECEITLKDLQEIKKCFNYILTGMFHRRIDYPGFEITQDNGIHKEPAKTDKDRPEKDKKGSTEDPYSIRAALG